MAIGRFFNLCPTPPFGFFILLEVLIKAYIRESQRMYPEGFLSIQALDPAIRAEVQKPFEESNL